MQRWVLLAVCCWPLAVHAQAVRVSGFVSGAGVYATGPKSWLEGGFGKLDQSGNGGLAEAQTARRKRGGLIAGENGSSDEKTAPIFCRRAAGKRGRAVGKICGPSEKYTARRKILGDAGEICGPSENYRSRRKIR